jgi:hypothetical protein
MSDVNDKYKQNFLTMKKERREKKRSTKRGITGEEVIFIFEKILAGWKTIRIYNTMIQQTPDSGVDKKKVEVIATGNSKIYESELDPEKYKYYLELREKVYAFHKSSSHVNEKTSNITHPPPQAQHAKSASSSI